VKFILQFPDTHGLEGDMLGEHHVGEVAAEAERAGFDALSLTDHPAPGANWLAHGGHQSVDPFVGLAFAAAATERIKLLTYLAVLPYRNPFVTAKAAATLDRLSGGRFVLGVGAGYLKSEFFALGVDFDERNELFDECLDVMTQCWSGEPFSYTGKHFDARNVVHKPVPAQRPIPIWIGGNSKLSRRRVAQRAQGWMPMGGSPELAQTARTLHIESFDALAAMVREVKETAGDRADELDFCVMYHDESIHSDVTADADRHREAFARYEEAGFGWLVVGGRDKPSAAHTEWVEAFGATYLDDRASEGRA
jgi:probable F420-dependent oxidoreductase